MYLCDYIREHTHVHIYKSSQHTVCLNTYSEDEDHA